MIQHEHKSLAEAGCRTCAGGVAATPWRAGGEESGCSTERFAAGRSCCRYSWWLMAKCAARAALHKWKGWGALR